jgi:tetratricopeptide (TPR) repeat protein
VACSSSVSANLLTITCGFCCTGIWDGIHGKENPKLARVLADLATIYEKQKKYQQALESLQRSRACMVKGHGDKAPEVQGITCALANVHAQLGQNDEAQKLFQEAVAHLKESKHASLVAALSMYHKFLVAHGKSEEAASVEAELNALHKK